MTAAHYRSETPLWELATGNRKRLGDKAGPVSSSPVRSSLGHESNKPT